MQIQIQYEEKQVVFRSNWYHFKLVEMDPPQDESSWLYIRICWLESILDKFS